MVGVRVGWGGPLSNPLECGFWQLGFLHCLKPQASLGGAALCWARLCYELVLLKSLHLPWKSLQRWGREEQYLFLLILQSTQPRYADGPGLQACLISQGGCLSVRGEGAPRLCWAYLSPMLLPGLGRSGAVLPGVRLNILGSCTSLLFLGAHLTLQ